MSIHQEGVLSRKCVACLGAWLVVSGLLLWPGRGTAQDITMQDQGSTATLNLGGGTGNLGMNSWSVGGQNQLNQQWFWYSINGAVAQSVDTLGLSGAPITAPGADGINDVAVTYQSSQLQASVEYILSGNGVGSGSADMTENISLKNVGLGTFTLNFFQYSDFNLLGGQNDTVNISGTPFVSGNAFSGWSGASQTTGNGGSGIAEVVAAPNATYAEANTVGGPNSTLARLTTQSNFNLNNNTSAGPGDVTWSFEWTAVLNPGDTLQIMKDKGLSIQVVPEPSAAALAVLGGLCLMSWTVRRRHSVS